MSADMHRGQRASLGNQTDHAIKAGYKKAADFFATQHEFLLLPGRHPYKKHHAQQQATPPTDTDTGKLALHLRYGARAIEFSRQSHCGDWHRGGIGAHAGAAQTGGGSGRAGCVDRSRRDQTARRLWQVGQGAKEDKLVVLQLFLARVCIPSGSHQRHHLYPYCSACARLVSGQATARSPVRCG